MWLHGKRMNGIMALKRLAALSIGIGVSLTGAAHAQERNLPALNSFGRFFGIGWSRGYHAGAYDGRFQHEKASHPASMYGSNALLYPYQPGYEPPRPFMQASPALAQPVYSNTVEMQGFGSILQGPSNQPMPNASTQLMPSQAPAIPAKPIEPPPTWLRPFLKEEANQPVEQSKSSPREDVPAEETSPSDLLELQSNPANLKKEQPQKASDDDDLLTLSPPKSPMDRYIEARRKQGSNR